MHKAVFPAFLVVSSLAVSAHAQFVGKPAYEPVSAPSLFVADIGPPGPGTARELRQIRDRIDRARDSGTLSRKEARQLHREARLIGRNARLFGRDGLSQSERRELQTRTQVLRESISQPRLR